MPWTGKSIQAHNKALHGEKADHAARIANAVLRSGQPEGLALAIANHWAQAHRRADGGSVSPGNPMFQSGWDAINAIHAAADRGVGPQQPSPTGAAAGPYSGNPAFQPGWDALNAIRAAADRGVGPQQQPAQTGAAALTPAQGAAPPAQGTPPPPSAQPSYLAGTAGSPMNASTIPQFVAAHQAVNPVWPGSGLMNTPQTGDFYLDPQTGAMSGNSQAALKALAQRGLQIGAPAAAVPAAGTGTGQQPILGQNGINTTEGAGNGGNGGGGSNSGVDVNVSGGAGGGSSGNTSGFADPGHQGPGISSTGMLDLAGLGISAATGNPVGAAIALGKGAYDVVTGNFGSMGNTPDDVSGAGFGGSSGPVDSHNDTSNPGDTGAASDTGGGNARGGAIKRATGGMMGALHGTPLRQPMTRTSAHPSGLVMSPIGGRSDHIPMSLASGSYVVPADVMSGIGQGNGMNGAHQFDQMIHSGPYGTKMPVPKMHGTLPKPPSMPKTVAAHHFSRGGRTKDHVPVIVAGGERIVSPTEVAALSGGDVKRGHELLDDWVVRARKAIIDVMKKLPAPVK